VAPATAPPSTNFAPNFDLGLVEGLAKAAGIEQLDVDDGGRLPRRTIDGTAPRSVEFGARS